MPTQKASQFHELLSSGGFFAAIWRRKWIVLAVFAVLFAGVAYYEYQRPDLYQAELKLIVKRVPSVNDSGSPAETVVTDSQMATETQLVRNRDSLEDAARRCNLLEFVTKQDVGEGVRLALAVRELDRNLTVESIGGSKMIQIRFSHPDPSRAAQVVRTLAGNYLAKRLDVQFATERQRILNVLVVEDAAIPSIPMRRHGAALLALGALLAALSGLMLALAADLALPPPQTLHTRRQQEALARQAVLERLNTRITESRPPETGHESVGSVSPEAATQEPGEPEPPIQDAAASAIIEPEPVAEEPAAEPLIEEPASPEMEAAPQPVDEAPGERETIGAELLFFSSAPRPSTAEPAGPISVIPRDVLFRDKYGLIVEYLAAVQEAPRGLAVGISPTVPTEDVALASVQLAYSMRRRNGLPILLVDAAGGDEPLAGYFGLQRAAGLYELLTRAGGSEKDCIHATGFPDLWLLPRGGAITRHGTVPARIEALREALSNRSMNLIVHLPNIASAQPVSWMLYSVPDAVLSSLAGEGGPPENTGELIRCVVDAKKHLSDRRLTLIGGANEWLAGDAETLTVC